MFADVIYLCALRKLFADVIYLCAPCKLFADVIYQATDYSYGSVIIINVVYKRVNGEWHI